MLYRLLISLLPNGSADSGEMQKMICKIFWSATEFSIPVYVQQPEIFQQWMTLFNQILSSPVPTVGMPDDAEERNGWAHWKVMDTRCMLIAELSHMQCCRGHASANSR